MSTTDNNHISNDDTNSNINYQKRKNTDLFKALEKPETLFLSKIQNYIPIYNRFFSLNETNYNNINLNHNWYLYNIKNKEQLNNDTKKIFQCRIKNIENDEIKNKNVFIKLAPLLDPFKYLVGKYSNVDEDKLFNLPDLDSINNNNKNNCHTKLLDINNSAYVDGLFVFLTSILKKKYKFTHGLEYYGSFLSIKNDFVLNVFDDLDYLNNSDFFNKNKNVLFKIDDYEHLIKNEKQKLKSIKIDYTSTAKSSLSFKSINNDFFENIFNDNEKFNNSNSNSNSNNVSENVSQDIREHIFDIELDSFDIKCVDDINAVNTSLKSTSSSSCSSRISYTNSETSETYESNEINNNNNDFDTEQDSGYTTCKSDSDWEDIDSNFEHDEESDNENDDNDDNDDDEFNEEEINVTIKKFPVELICMENCENTLDDLILNNELSTDEWLSALMQIIMILITYQKVFSFTHNDLHTNNIMYNETSKKFIVYYYNNKTYKVPTFGKIFKIIDFGRSIYKFQGKLFCSDSFQTGNDAASQYNTEPYFDDKKPRLEPNFSFDLSRLACSIFDYLVDDLEEIKDVNKIEDPIKKLIIEWCLDDNGINLLYKNNGDERYPDFKLYKMISRHVHNHTPQVQLDRSEFNNFIIENQLNCEREKKGENYIRIDIDKMSSLV
jgi:hypothetical protein